MFLVISDYLTTHNNHKGQTPMLPAGFEPAIPAGERPQTHALDCAAIRTGLYVPYILNVVVYKNNLSLYTSLLLPEILLLKVLAWHGKRITVCGILMTYAL